MKKLEVFWVGVLVGCFFFHPQKSWKERRAQVKMSKLFENYQQVEMTSILYGKIDQIEWQQTICRCPSQIETLILGCNPRTLVSFTRMILKSGHFFRFGWVIDITSLKKQCASPLLWLVQLNILKVEGKQRSCVKWEHLLKDRGEDNACLKPPLLASSNNQGKGLCKPIQHHKTWLRTQVLSYTWLSCGRKWQEQKQRNLIDEYLYPDVSFYIWRHLEDLQ